MQRCIIPYSPRPLQREFHDTRKRFAVMICHRRFGKTVAAVNDLIRQAVRAPQPDWRAAYMAPYMRQAKSVAWDYLRQYAGVIPGVRFMESELRCDLPGGGRIRLLGTENAEALRGLYLDDLVLDEPADMPRSVWTRILRPALADRKGRALFIGTPKGTSNLLHDVWQEALGQGGQIAGGLAEAPPSGIAGTGVLAAAGAWSAHCYRASVTGYVDEAELASARLSMAPDEYAQEFECSFAAAVRGAYYAPIMDQMEQDGRMGPVAWEPALLVHTGWDLGMDDATAIWFFQTEPSGDWRVIDYYENSGEGLPHYASVLQSKPYAYGRHVAPHDIMVRELGSGKSRLETARDLGLRFDACPAMAVMDGINAVRLRLPRMWFDTIRCAEGLRALRHYRKVWNPLAGVYADKPLHDWTSHAADALRYAVLGVRENGQGREQDSAHRQSRTISRRPRGEG